MIHDKLYKYAIAKGDNNNCALVAVSISANVSYEVVEQEFECEGRIKGKGVRMSTILDVLVRLSKDVVEIEDNRIKTPVTAERYLDKDKNYILTTRNHALAMTGGVIRDWTKGRRFRITKIYEVVPYVKSEVRILSEELEDKIEERENEETSTKISDALHSAIKEVIFSKYKGYLTSLKSVTKAIDMDKMDEEDHKCMKYLVDNDYFIKIEDWNQSFNHFFKKHNINKIKLLKRQEQI